MSERKFVQTTTFRTNDFEALQDASADWDQQYFRMAPGHFEGGIELTQVGSTQIFRERWNRKFMYRGTTPKGTYAVALPIDQPGHSHWLGAPVSEDTVILQSPRREADLVSAAHMDMLVLAVPEQEAEVIASSLSDRPVIGGELQGVVTLAPEAAARLRFSGLEFLRQSRTAGPEEWDQITTWSEKLVKSCLWELAQARDTTEDRTSSARYADIVRKATELVLSDEANTHGLLDICASLDVSLRTLHNAFQSVTGISPATWLRRIHLNRVHKTLLRAAPDEVRVKTVAIDNGFFHLGHFAQQYRRLYDCSPSQTLRAS